MILEEAFTPVLSIKLLLATVVELGAVVPTSLMLEAVRISNADKKLSTGPPVCPAAQHAYCPYVVMICQGHHMAPIRFCHPFASQQTS